VHVEYKCTDFYDRADEIAVAWDDPEVGIEWPPDMELVASDRDRTAPALAAIRDELPFT
jgi:dTDP-4-dehydrorhamnose 3,5-epimerase